MRLPLNTAIRRPCSKKTGASSAFPPVSCAGRRCKTSALYDFDCHIMRIGPCAFATSPFELYMEYGMRIRARCRASHVFNVQLCGDSDGYLPSQAAVEAGGYSAVVSVGLVSPAGGDLYVETAIDRINALFLTMRRRNGSNACKNRLSWEARP